MSNLNTVYVVRSMFEFDDEADKETFASVYFALDSAIADIVEEEVSNYCEIATAEGDLILKSEMADLRKHIEVTIKETIMSTTKSKTWEDVDMKVEKDIRINFEKIDKIYFIERVLVK